jgi:hypothetical protein
MYIQRVNRAPPSPLPTTTYTHIEKFWVHTCEHVPEEQVFCDNLCHVYRLFKFTSINDEGCQKHAFVIHSELISNTVLDLYFYTWSFNSNDSI